MEGPRTAQYCTKRVVWQCNSSQDSNKTQNYNIITKDLFWFPGITRFLSSIIPMNFFHHTHELEESSMSNNLLLLQVLQLWLLYIYVAASCSSRFLLESFWCYLRISYSLVSIPSRIVTKRKNSMAQHAYVHRIQTFLYTSSHKIKSKKSNSNKYPCHISWNIIVFTYLPINSTHA